MATDTIYHFNVSGVHVDISSAKLLPHHKSLLVNMINNISQPNERLFIDCNPRIFEHILQFINHGIKINTELISRSLNITASDLIGVVSTFGFENIFFLDIWETCNYHYLPLVKYYLKTDLHAQGRRGLTPIMVLLFQGPSLYSNGTPIYREGAYRVSDRDACLEEYYNLGAEIIPSINYRNKNGHTVLDYLTCLEDHEKCELLRQNYGAVSGISKNDCKLKNVACSLGCCDNNNSCVLL
jgi:hypothetical protein